MKSFLYFVVVVLIISVSILGIWSIQTEATFEEQFNYLRNKYFSKIEKKVSNTTDSASKLGEVLKDRFNEAKDVYEKGVEAKYE